MPDDLEIDGDLNVDSGHLSGLFRHRGVTPIRPLPQSHGRESPNSLIVSSGPVNLDIRPLSNYQQTLIDAVLSLRSRGWSDRQIAKHFNDAGYLTPRGHRWFPQSVYSMRMKYGRRLARLGGGW